jgi:hypothetical protein
MPTFNRNGRAFHMPDFRRFAGFDRRARRWIRTSRIPISFQTEPWELLFENGRRQWEFAYPPGDDSWQTGLNMVGARSNCNNFFAGPRLRISGVVGYSLFSHCNWSWSGAASSIQWTVYSTDWETQVRNGNSRGRNQVLLWTQRDSQCCASTGRSDAVSQGIWRFEHVSNSTALHGREFLIPIGEW